MRGGNIKGGLVKNKRKSESSSNGEFARARALIQKKGNIRNGLAILRHNYNPEQLLRLAPIFAAHPAYRSLVWANPFPKSFETLPKQGMPYYEGISTEIAWAAGVLLPYASKIEKFGLADQNLII